jgi:hypothetical protein
MAVRPGFNQSVPVFMVEVFQVFSDFNGFSDDAGIVSPHVG